jgi:leucyl aminopeptidase
MKIAFAEPDLPRSGAAVAGIWEGGGLTPGARRLDEATDGAITRALAGAARFSGKKGELLAIVAPAKLPLSRIVVAGLGKREKADARLYEDLGGALAAHLNGAGETEATIAGDVAEEAPIAAGEAAAALAFGAALRTYRFDKYKTKQKPEQKRSLAQLTVSSEASDAAERAYRPLQQTAEAVFFTRGSAVVIGLMRLLAARKAKVNAVGIVGLVENMPSGTAQRPGDIVTSMSGQTIEVLNTDAEGRLVLADAMWYCQDRFKPRLMVDLATLTGAVIVALGHNNAGLFSNDDEIAARLIETGKAVGEEVWRMPLGDAYDRDIDSDAADVKNIGGGRAAGSVTAAQFLQRFVDKVPWAHLDIAGMAWSSKDAATVPKGATAFGVRLLDRFVARYYEDE